MLPKKLIHLLQNRKKTNSFRSFKSTTHLVDFSSNDYLGFSRSEILFGTTTKLLSQHKLRKNGSGGSRLLSGNHKLYDLVENQLCQFHDSEAALIFNSGYDANLGLFSSVPQRRDIIIYDELIHASIRDGLKMTPANHYKYRHNDLKNLEQLLIRHATTTSRESTCIYVVTESVFSMDGDYPELSAISELCEKYGTYLIVDEAHAIGVLGTNGKGLIEQHQLQTKTFARIVTFGKALGCHGASILGSDQLKDFLINYSRPLIYTTALPPHSLASIKASYLLLESEKGQAEMISLKGNIKHFKNELSRLALSPQFIKSDSAIQCCLISGNDRVKQISNQLCKEGFDVKPILSPTVPAGKERLRFCIHAFNTKKEISEVLNLLSTFA